MPRQPASLTVDIEGLDPEDGSGYVSTAAGRLRVDYVLPGERVEVRRASPHTVPLTPGVGRRLTPGVGGQAAAAWAEPTRILRPSPHRVTPRCPYFGPCGGCTWQHIAWTEQLRLKEGMLRTLLAASLGASAPPVAPTLTDQEPGERTPDSLSGAAGDDQAPWGFRNKAHFVLAPASRAGGLVLGHYQRRSQAVVEVDVCPVHAAEGNRVAFAIRDALVNAGVDGTTPDGRRGIARHIVVRATEAPPETLATLVVTRNDKRLRAVVRDIVDDAAPDGLHLTVNDRPGPYLFGRHTRRLHGRDRARETIGGISFLISPAAFFQTNVRAAAKMVELVLEQAGDAETALDLYAGAGLFALPLASRGVRMTAIEENAEAVEDGEATRRFNRIAESACRFVRARAEDVAEGRTRLARFAAPDLVVLDPPRSGCPARVLEWICSSIRPRRIVYISCNPHALAGDLRVALGARYRAELIQPVDMFPHTQHIETIAVLSRRI